MICTFVKNIYEGDNGYRVHLYSTEDESVPKDARNSRAPKGKIWFTGTGYYLPDTNAIDYDLEGKWESGKYGLQLKIEKYKEVLPATEDGMIGYLCSGLIKGIGPKTAVLIVKKFGLNTFDILDQHPERLLEIKGISEIKLHGIIKSCSDSKAMRSIISYLSPFKISEKASAKVFETFKGDSIRILKTQPFQLCSISGIGYKKADEIARKTNCNLKDPLRIQGAIQFTLDEAAVKGHLYMPSADLVVNTTHLLNDGLKVPIINDGMVQNELDKFTGENKLIIDLSRVFKPIFRKAEVIVAKRVLQMLESSTLFPGNLEAELASAQSELNILLATGQADGVKMSLTETISILTGGPGTGKTTTLEVILYIYQRIHPGNKILLAAPTGRASKRMSETTGFSSASTVHSALGLISSNDVTGFFGDKHAIEAQLVVIDEFSMIDMLLAGELFSRIRRGTQLLIIGDPDQLPSVGAGNVLRELIRCALIPTTQLEFVYRQEAGSDIDRIAHLINQGETNEEELKLENSSDFIFLSAKDDETAAQILLDQYLMEVKAHGLDSVQILAPMRHRGKTCVDNLNMKAQELINPPGLGKMEIKYGNSIFREGDKVMQIKNNYDINWTRDNGEQGVGVFNGDIGFITGIGEIDDEMTLTVKFNDSIEVIYLRDELDQLELAYCCSIHKSQGAEFDIVLMPLLTDHYIMLRRNLIYTAITRAAKKMYLIGQKKALFKAIANNDVDARNTLLADRIISYHRRMQAEVIPVQTSLFGKTGS